VPRSIKVDNEIKIYDGRIVYGGPVNITINAIAADVLYFLY
jgi:hypothetical protein